MTSKYGLVNFYYIWLVAFMNCNIVLFFYSLKRNSDERDKNQNK